MFQCEMLINNFPAFPGLWNLLQTKPGFPPPLMENQFLFLSHGTGALTRLSGYQPHWEQVVLDLPRIIWDHMTPICYATALR